MRKTKEDAEQTRTAILNAAEKLFCAQGTAAVSLEKISKKAGVTRGALYWHFKDKLDLLRALHERSIPPQKILMRTAAENNPEDPLGLLEQSAIDMLEIFEVDQRQQRMFRIMNAHMLDKAGSQWSAEVNIDLCQTLRKLTELAGAQGSLNPDFTPEETTVLLMSSMSGLLNEWLRSDKSFALAELGSKMLRKQMEFIRVKKPTD